MFYFGLRWVSLAEYLLVLRTLFPLLLQMIKCTMAIVLTACIRRWAITRTKAMVTPYLSSDAFVGDDYYWHCIWTKSVCVALKLFASGISAWTWVVITLCSKLWCIQRSLRTLCNMWRWLLNLYDLGLYVGWFEILRGFTDYRVIRV
jgi:hypothetical protein